MVDFNKKLEDAKKLDPTQMKERINKAIKGTAPKGGTVTNAPLADPRVSATHQEALTALDNAKARVVEVQEIHTDLAYKEADVFLGEIEAIKDRWLIGTEKVPGINKIIEPIYKGLEGLYALRSGIITPLEELETKVKSAMGKYQLALKRQKAEEERLKLEAIEAERAKAEQLRIKAEAAKTPQMAARFNNQAAQQDAIVQQIAEVETTPLPTGTFSHARSSSTGKKWKLDSTQEFIRGLASGLIPYDCLSSITLNIRQMNAYYKEDPTTVGQWPGIIEEDDISIVHGRGRRV